MSWVTHFHICLLCFWSSFFKCRLIKEVLTFVFGLSCCGAPHNCRLFGKKTYNYWNRSWKLALKILNVIPISLLPFDIFSTLSLFSRANHFNPFWLPDYNFASLSYNQAFRSFWPDIFLFFQPLSSVYDFCAACVAPHSLSLHKKRLIAGCNYTYVQEPRSSDLERSPFLFLSLSFNFHFRRTPRFRILAMLLSLCYKVLGTSGTRNKNRETSQQNGKSKD